MLSRTIAALMITLIAADISLAAQEPLRPGAKAERKKIAVKEKSKPPMAEEEPRRLRGDLLDYYREAYPDSSLFQARRNLMRERMSQHLSEADGDQDGGLSREEVTRQMPALARHFDTIDANGDGQIDHDEIEHARGRMFQGRMDR